MPSFPITSLRVPDEDDEEVDGADLFDVEFLEHMEALKQACQMMPGAEVRLKTSTTLAEDGFAEDGFAEDGDGEVDNDDDDDDDDALLLSIERRFLGKGGGLVGGKDEGQRVVGRNGGGAKGAQSGGISGELSQLGRSSALAAHAEDGDDEDEDLLRSVKESCGALDLVKASKNLKTSFPNGEADFNEDDVQPIFSLEDDVGGRAGNAASVGEPQIICSFLPAQLSDEEFDESPVPLVVHDPTFASNGGKVKVPESVHAVTEALLKNRACQQSLREVLRQVELKLQENREMERRAVSLVEYQKVCTRKFCGFTEAANSSVELITTKPASKRKAGEFKVKGPPENPDFEVFRQLQGQLPAEFNVKKWTKKETHALAKGVRQQLQEIRVRSMMESWDSDEEGQDFDEQMRSIGESEEELTKGSPSIDWTEVARIYVSGRSPWECRLQWVNNEHPLLNPKPWTKAEDKKLLSIVQAHDMVEWAAIAEELGTQRTPVQCAIRFQRSLNASILRSNFTLEEDEQLQAAVKKFGEKDWQSVAACMEGRLGSQCMSRWTKVLHPDRHRRGRWLAEEDTRLKWAVSVYGPRGWKNIAAHVPGRSDVQCRERWCNVLDPLVKIDEWIPEEDAKLEELVLKYGRHRWAAVGAELGRTDNQCFRHWKLLHPEHKISFNKDMVIRRAALSTNFVGREKERPDLGFQDFLAPSGVGEEGNRRALPQNKPNTSKGKFPPKLRKSPSKNRKISDYYSEVNENPPLEKEVPTPELPSIVTENSDDTAEVGLRMNEADQPVERAYTRRIISELPTSNVKVAPKPRKRPSKKTESPEPSSEVNENLPIENEVPTPALSLTVIENNGNIAEACQRKRRAAQSGAKASKKRKTPEVSPVVVEKQCDTAEPSIDEKDAPLIVYSRRKGRSSVLAI